MNELNGCRRFYSFELFIFFLNLYCSNGSFGLCAFYLCFDEWWNTDENESVLAYGNWQVIAGREKERKKDTYIYCIVVLSNVSVQQTWHKLLKLNKLWIILTMQVFFIYIQQFDASTHTFISLHFISDVIFQQNKHIHTDIWLFISFVWKMFVKFFFLHFYSLPER